MQYLSLCHKYNIANGFTPKYLAEHLPPEVVTPHYHLRRQPGYRLKPTTELYVKNAFFWRIGSILNPLAGKFSEDTRKKDNGAKTGASHDWWSFYLSQYDWIKGSHMTKVVWFPNETDYSYCEFVAPNTPYCKWMKLTSGWTTPIVVLVYLWKCLLKTIMVLRNLYLK